LEFYQFHPTSLAVPGNPLISEAVRGEGAVLIDESGARFMLDVHPDGELAPRDIVARGIAAQMALQAGRPVLLDAAALGHKFLADRFPGITATTASHGFDWASEPIPVTPAAHYWMGGVRTDAVGRTSIAGLLAVGEVSNTGVHGANRLASNSLLESLVFAWRAAAALDAPWIAPAFTEIQVLTPSHDRNSSGRGESTPEFPEFTRGALQQLMWDEVGLYRSRTGLDRAAAVLADWAVAGETVHDLENRNLLDLGRAVVVAALAREESRGAHYRSDFPSANAAFARHITLEQTEKVPA
jgi:L-aspartate oxidase